MPLLALSTLKRSNTRTPLQSCNLLEITLQDEGLFSLLEFCFLFSSILASPTLQLLINDSSLKFLFIVLSEAELFFFFIKKKLLI